MWQQVKICGIIALAGPFLADLEMYEIPVLSEKAVNVFYVMSFGDLCRFVFFQAFSSSE